MNCKLNIAAARVHAHRANDRNADVAQTLHLAVSQGQCRCNRDRVARVHADRIDVLDRTHDNDVIRFVAHKFEFVFLPTEDRLLQEYLGRNRSRQSLAGDALEVLWRVGEAGAKTTHREGGTHNERITQLGGSRVAFLDCVSDEGTRDLGAGTLDDLLKLLAVLASTDRID